MAPRIQGPGRSMPSRRIVVKHPIRYDEDVIVAPVPGYWPGEMLPEGR
jgi:hypothetical protein